MEFTGRQLLVDLNAAHEANPSLIKQFGNYTGLEQPYLAYLLQLISL